MVCVCVWLCVFVYIDQVSMANQARWNPLNKTDSQPHQIAIAATVLCLCIFEWLKWPTLGFHTVARITHTPPGALRKLRSGIVSQAINQANWHVPWTNTCIAMQQGSQLISDTPLSSSHPPPSPHATLPLVAQQFSGLRAYLITVQVASELFTVYSAPPAEKVNKYIWGT